MPGLFYLLGGDPFVVFCRRFGGGGGVEVVMIRIKSKRVLQTISQSISFSSDYLQNNFFSPFLTTRDYYLNDSPKCIIGRSGS